MPASDQSSASVVSSHRPASTPDQGQNLHAKPVITLDDVQLSLTNGQEMVNIIKGITLSVNQGQSVAILGPSGAGKTSLLMLIAGLEQASSGRIALADKDITHLDEDALARLRRDLVGIVFQAFRLIPSMTALQNVAVPLELAGNRNANQMAAEALEAVGLGHRLDHLPDQMSGGEQQRVAIARAIAPRPQILLADEPTGNLDSRTGALVIEQLFSAAEQVGAALVLITHDVSLAARCARILTIEDGRLVDDQLTDSKPHAGDAK